MFVVHVSFDFWVYANVLYMAAALIIVCVQFFSFRLKIFKRIFFVAVAKEYVILQSSIYSCFSFIFFYIIQKYKTIVHVSIHLIYPHPVYKTFVSGAHFSSVFFSFSLAITYPLLLTK